MPEFAGIKYTVSVHRRASDTFSLTLGRSSVDAVIRTLNDGGLLVQASTLHRTTCHLIKQRKLFNLPILRCQPGQLGLQVDSQILDTSERYLTIYSYQIVLSPQ